MLTQMSREVQCKLNNFTFKYKGLKRNVCERSRKRLSLFHVAAFLAEANTTFFIGKAGTYRTSKVEGIVNILRKTNFSLKDCSTTLCKPQIVLL